jgi:membrane protease YdiL (CAAX protease family)
VLGFAGLFWVAVRLSLAHVLPFSMENKDFYRASVPGTILWAVLSNFGPALSAIIALSICQGRAGLAALGRSVIRWRVRPWLYVLGLFGAVVNVAVVIAAYTFGSTRFDPSQFSLGRFTLLFFAMAVVDGPLGEEIGWRGLLLPELMRRMTALPAALLVGVVWYVWHVPIFAANGRTMSGWEHLGFFYSCVALSVLFTWFFIRSGGSTFLAIYLHAFSNYFTFVRFKLFPSISPSWLRMVVYLAVLSILAVIAAVALWRNRARGQREELAATV